MKKRRSQSGNVVILILVAVGLFGALAYTFMRGSEQGQGNLTSNQARIAAQQILTYNNNVERNVQKLLSRGCSENQLSFGNSVYTTAGGAPLHSHSDNPNRSADGRCDVFESTGAGFIPQKIPSEALAEGVSLPPGNTGLGSSNFITFRMPSVGNASLAELLITGDYLTIDVCKAYNDLAGVTNPSGNLPKGVFTYQNYNGTFGDTRTFTDTDGVLAGKDTYCYQETPTSSGTVQKILHVR